MIERLLKVTENIWKQYYSHPFVKGIQDGTLDKEKFRYYIIQDYLYLEEYAKVFEIGLAKAKSLSTTRLFSGYIDTLKLRELNNNDVSKKPFIMTEKYTADIIVKSIEENRDKIVFPIKMKIAVSILSMFPKKILSMILLRKKNEK